MHPLYDSTIVSRLLFLVPGNLMSIKKSSKALCLSVIFKEYLIEKQTICFPTRCTVFHASIATLEES